MKKSAGSTIPQSGYIRRFRLAQALGVSVTTIDRWVREKRLPRPVKLGEKITVFDAVEINNWLAERRGKAPEKIHDHACINRFLDRGPCLGDCHVADVNKARSSSFEDVVKPVIKWLNENANPHTSVNIDVTSAQLLTGEICIHTEGFIND